jgi:hypothetical protein
MRPQGKLTNSADQYLRRMASCHPLADTSVMTKRIGSAALWFVAIGWGFNYIAALTGMSPAIGMAIAAWVGAFVGLDPLHLFWAAPIRAEAGPARDAVPVSGAMQTQV